LLYCKFANECGSELKNFGTWSVFICRQSCEKNPVVYFLVQSEERQMLHIWSGLGGCRKLIDIP